MLSFVAIAMMIAVAFVGFTFIADDGSDAADKNNFIVDGKGYNTFEDAIAAAKASPNKELKFNVDDKTSFLTGNFNVSYEVSGLTIDLNEHTITTVNGGFVLEGVGFTVCNGTIDAQGESYALGIGNGKNTENVTVKDLILRGGVNVYCAKNVSLKGITYYGTNYYSAWSDQSGGIIIKDGTYESLCAKTNSLLGVSKSKGSMLIVGGTFIVKEGKTLALQGDYNSPVIEGGFFYKQGGDSDSALFKELTGYLKDDTYCVAKATATIGDEQQTGYRVMLISEAEASITADGVTTYYATFEDAAKASTEGQKIDILNDIVMSETVGSEDTPIFGSIEIAADKNIAFDLGGYAIYSQAEKVFDNMGTLILGNGEIFQYKSGYTAIKNFANGVLTIEDLNVTIIDGKDGHTGIAVKQDDYDKEGGSLVTDPKGYITINSGTFTAGQAVQAWGNVTIEGGTFNGQITAITCKGDNAGNIGITGGTFNSDLVAVSLKDWAGEDGQSPVIFVDMNNVILKDGINVNVGYADDTTQAFVGQSEYPKDSGSIPIVVIQGTLPNTVNTNASIAMPSTSDDGVESTGYLAFLEDAVKVLGKPGITATEVEIIFLKNISAVTPGNTNEAAFWFANDKVEITIDGNGKVMTYDADEATDDANKRFNVIGFGSGVTASIKDLVINGNFKARNGINIYQSADIVVSDVTISNIKMAGIVANACTLTVEDCDVGMAGGVGGINVDAKGMKASLTVNGFFVGSIWTESRELVTVAYDECALKIESDITDDESKVTKWACWFSEGDDSVVPWIDDFIEKGDVSMEGYLILEKEMIDVPKDRTFIISEGSTFTGTIVGPQSGDKDNKLVAQGLKAGTNGITFTGGSLIINGIMMADGSSEGGVTVTVSGDAIKIEGTLEEGATMVINEGTTVTIEAEFASNGTIVVEGTMVNNGTVSNAGTLKVTGSSEVSGTPIVNTGIVADKRTTGTAVPIDTTSTGKLVVTEDNASAYEGSSTKIIIETDKITSGTITSNTDEYVFVDAVTTTGKLKIVMNGGQYTITIPAGTAIPAATVISVVWKSTGSDTVVYDIDTGDITKFTAKLPTIKGFVSAKVYCDGYKIDGVKYIPSSGYVTFDAEHNSTFTITLSNAPDPVDVDTSGSDGVDQNLLFIGAVVLLMLSILTLAAVIMRK